MPRGRLGTLLANRREAAGLTQEELSQLTPVNREALAHVERGRTKQLGPEMVNRLAEVLPVTVEELCQAMGYEVTADPKEG